MRANTTWTVVPPTSTSGVVVAVRSASSDAAPFTAAGDTAPKPANEKDKATAGKRDAFLQLATSLDAKVKSITAFADETDKLVAALYAVDAQGSSPIDAAIRGGKLSDAMAGKATYTQKPLTHTVWESRQLALAAKKYKVATQMGNQGHGQEGWRIGVEYVKSGCWESMLVVEGESFAPAPARKILIVSLEPELSTETKTSSVPFKSPSMPTCITPL